MQYIARVGQNHIYTLSCAFPGRQRKADIEEWKAKRHNSVGRQDIFVEVPIAILVEVRHAEKSEEQRDGSAKTVNPGTQVSATGHGQHRHLPTPEIERALPPKSRAGPRG